MPAHLYVQRPSPTTVGFTVSNAPSNPALSRRLLSYAMALCSVLLGVSSILVLVLRARCAASSLDADISSSSSAVVAPSFMVTATDVTSVIGDNAFTSTAVAGATTTSQCSHWMEQQSQALAPLAILLDSHWYLVMPLCALVLYYCCQRPYIEESLLVLQSLGIQTSTSSNTYLTSAMTRFIPTSEIQDIFIHEAFIGFEVRYYLAIVVKNEPELTVVFPKLLPRRAILEEVWRGARSCMFTKAQRDQAIQLTRQDRDVLL